MDRIPPLPPETLSHFLNFCMRYVISASYMATVAMKPFIYTFLIIQCMIIHFFTKTIYSLNLHIFSFSCYKSILPGGGYEGLCFYVLWKMQARMSTEQQNSCTILPKQFFCAIYSFMCEIAHQLHIVCCVFLIYLCINVK